MKFFYDVCYFFKFIFNWRIIVLQYCVGFLHTMRISHKCIYVHFLLNLLPTPSYFSRLLQGTVLTSLCDTATSHFFCFPLSRIRQFATSWTIQPMEFSRPGYWSGQPFPSPEDLPNPGIEPRSPALQADSLPAEPQGKPKNTGVGSLSLLQWIVLTQESNRGLLHCRQTLYQLSYI